MIQVLAYLFHNAGPYHIETSPLICIANQWTGFYMIGASVMKELNLSCIQDELNTWGPLKKTQQAITCLKLTIETVEQCVKYYKS